MNVRGLIWFNDKLLLVKKNYGSKHWTFPGGAVEKGETAEEAIKREIWEEVNLEVNNPVAVGNYTTEFKNKKIVVMCFSFKVTSQDFKVDEKEIEKANWFGLDNFPTPLSSTVGKVLSLDLCITV